MAKSSRGILFGIAAYTLWGIFPLYWRLISDIDARLILAHRIIWAAVFTLGLLAIRKQLPDVVKVLANRRSVLTIAAAAVLVTINWGVYIAAINAGIVLECALGYFINPLVSILLGVIFFKEKLTKAQLVAFLLATAAVLARTVLYGRFPWIAIILAMSFGLYGLAKKVVKAEAMVSLGIETTFAMPIAAVLVAIVLSGAVPLQHLGNIVHVDPVATALFLVLAGPVTAIPLLLFGTSARLIPLSLLGFLQYLSPSINLVIGVFILGESFGLDDALSFGLIWLGLAIFSIDQLRSRARRGKEA